MAGDIEIVGSPEFAVDIDTFSIVVNKPSGAAEGDVLLAILGVDSSDGIDLPPNFSLIDYGAIEEKPGGFSTGVVEESMIGYKILGPSEPSSYSFGKHNSETGAAILIALREVELDQILDVAKAADEFNDSASGTIPGPTSPSVTTVTEKVGVFSIFIGNDGDMSVDTPPAGMTLLQEVATVFFGGSGGGSGTSLGVAWEVQPLPGDTGSKAYTVDNDGIWRAVTVAIRAKQGENYPGTATFNGESATTLNSLLTVNPTLLASATANSVFAPSAIFRPSLSLEANAVSTLSVAAKYAAGSNIVAEAVTTAVQARKIPFAATLNATASATGIKNRKTSVSANVAGGGQALIEVSVNAVASASLIATATSEITPTAIIEMTGHSVASAQIEGDAVRIVPVSTVDFDPLARAEANLSSLMAVFYPKSDMVGIASTLALMSGAPVSVDVFGNAFVSAKLGGSFAVRGSLVASADSSISPNVKRKATGSISAEALTSANAVREVIVSRDISAEAVSTVDAVRKVTVSSDVSAESQITLRSNKIVPFAASIVAESSSQSDFTRTIGVASSIDALATAQVNLRLLAKTQANVSGTAISNLSIGVQTKYFLTARARARATIRGRLSKRAELHIDLLGVATTTAIARGALGLPTHYRGTLFVAPSHRRVFV